MIVVWNKTTLRRTVLAHNTFFAPNSCYVFSRNFVCAADLRYLVSSKEIRVHTQLVGSHCFAKASFLLLNFT